MTVHNDDDDYNDDNDNVDVLLTMILIISCICYAMLFFIYFILLVSHFGYYFNKRLLVQTQNKQCKSANILQCYHPHLADFCSRPRLTQPYNHNYNPGVAKIYVVFF